MSNLSLYNEFKKYLIDYTDDKTKSFPQRIIKSLKEVAPDKIFVFNNKPIILYFKESDTLTRDKIFRKYWNFSEAPIIFVETQTDIEIFNGFSYILKDKKPTPLKLNTDNLNYLSLISGEYFKSNSFENSNKKLDKILLKNIKDARNELLINLSSFSLREKLIKIKSTNNKKDIKKVFNSFTTIEDKEYINIQHTVNSLLGRIIFIRYLIDRKVSLYYNNKKQKITNDDLKNILSDKDKIYQFFRDLQSDEKGFNGDWFPISTDEEQYITQTYLDIIIELISGTDIKSGQRSLFDYYDFSIIPIEFISNVYEHFIGTEKQKKDGAYYTPTFLVDYVLKYTIDDYFKNNPNEYNCKVLDPACGSGIFLVETFRKLVTQYEKVTHKKADEKIIKKLVKDNIFGIDYNQSALEISVFSLYLAMLDYQEPKDIENFKFPHLIKENPNFFNNDFFDIEAPFNQILKDKKLNFIIGNPPYGRGSVQDNSFADIYKENQKINIGNRDIIQVFMVRVKDFSHNSTNISFIITSKVLYNLKSKEFRTKSFFNKFKVKHILELSSACYDIFENADVPVSIIFYKYSNLEEILKNSIYYISMKPSPYFEKLKLLLLSKSDFKKVAQSKLLEYDYLWKILVYGSYLDFYFIKRLNKYKKINSYITSKSVGITVGNKKKPVPNEYIGMSYVSTEQIKPFFIENNNKKWTESFVERTRRLDIFKAPSLLITKGTNTKLDVKIGILQKDSIFTGTITAIKNKDKNTLYNIMGLLKSSFFKYYILNRGSSIGIERPQIHNPEKFSLPYIENKNIIEATKNLEEYSKDDFAQYDKEFDNLREKLNQKVLQGFNLTEQEYSLVDYAKTILIPWVVPKTKKDIKERYSIVFSQYDYKDKRINEYVQIFTNHYSKIYEQNSLFFQATIYWSQYAIAIYFKILKNKPQDIIIWKKEENTERFLPLMQGKTLENLFIQKDIKGFEGDGFYVVKPNEIKNWHKAIGYLDFYEFDKAILKSGRKYV